MRRLDERALHDVARGAAVLGIGGGGDPRGATLAAVRALRAFGPPALAGCDALADDDLVVCPLLVGAVRPDAAPLPLGVELVAAFDALRRVLDRPVAALLPLKVGGVGGAAAALALAARTGLPVLDADATGRAFPQNDPTTFALHGVAATPAAVADGRGNAVVVTAADLDWTERLLGGAVSQLGGIAPFCGYPVTGAQVRAAGIAGTISLAERIGRTVREAVAAGADPIPGVLAATGGFALLRGTVAGVDRRRSERGWLVGETVVDGAGADAGRRATVAFQNESLVVRRADGALLAAVPDLIALIDADSGQAIAADRVRRGQRVVVLGIPCDARWRTPAGLALAGPRRFGYDAEHVPVERIAGAAAGIRQPDRIERAGRSSP
ncbi:DUF917 domain-containing protein [Conexibacter woesei]|uniref:DUF917 domain-containing protein n=1 Tax=Conexibacter woesei (strain DSM 14684 / CCUG 47730 / CIP 108061 / JCM 11494 / NBRC 100937 / ID131577) TaxID=469383 RepID=D3F5H0_CONWI|nr:DUF917 domain-containing protein [Conexibacter woesei]ADB50637.1 protein of unknown function DUF917 [Conexibacter woesei DSM 14684]